ncbi:S-layer homology domain-containing protein [Olsenella uli]|uniref:S-layer homology domain-containing protein n=1 Tax=Olsenella uli TaxID=133926 RepID=UPI00195E27BC|nr:S-layer homology domain-containing protein [Olsenella uli]MBM6676694.1 S-layer homology domain-containing protein [Olsenella uli]
MIKGVAKLANHICLILCTLVLISGLCPIVAQAVDMTRTVYVPKTGSKYHYVSDCSNMTSPRSMTLEEALSKGYEPCSNCVNEKAFSDMRSTTPHVDDVYWLAENGITTGFPDGTFRPYSSVARCDMAAFLRRLAVRMGVDGAATWTPATSDWDSFSDVNSTTPHAEDILWLAHTGISTGFSDGTFRPYATIARCDMAAFLHRLALLSGKAGASDSSSKASFFDVSSSTPHAGDIDWLASSKITTGFPDNTFRPYANVARCDMAAFLYRLYNL